MCGIVGIFDLRDGREIDRQVLEGMNQSQIHRGPDGYGYHIEPGLGLGHRRLSIIDIAGGQQPLCNEDGTVFVTYNGEIYNFRELANELEGRGHQFKSHCDTEVIVHAWEEWGTDCLERFNGMFAFAVWDRKKQELFLARDRLGIKPLYYTFTSNQQLVFSSELKGLRRHPEVSTKILSQAVEDYFAFGYVPDPKCIFAEVHKLQPGHYLLARRDQNQSASKQYWDVPFDAIDGADSNDLHHELISRLRESVNKQLVSDVPLGAFLSGGVDSSAVVALMAETSAEPVNTCSISFGDPRFNESAYADSVARQYKTNHRVEQVDPDDYGLIDRLVGLYDEPYADSSAIPTYRVCELARKDVTVALSGDGGDENFAGYRRYRWHAHEEKVRAVLPHLIRQPMFGALGWLYPKMDWAPRVFRAKSTLQALARTSTEGYLHSVSILPEDLRRKLFTRGFGQQLQGYTAQEVFREHAARAPSDHPLSLVQYLDFKTYLPGDILTKVDRASMAHSLEVRVPLLDHDFVGWVSGIERDRLLKGRQGKYVLKRALESRLSREILYRPKMGFSVPLAKWFRGSLRDRVTGKLLGPQLFESGIFEKRFVEQMVDQHLRGARDYSAPIWALLMFEGFQRQLLEI